MPLLPDRHKAHLHPRGGAPLGRVADAIDGGRKALGAALATLAGEGRIRVATDVFPEEPVAADDPIRDRIVTGFSAGLPPEPGGIALLR